MGIVFALTLLSSFAEVISIGAVLPFLSILISPQVVFEHPAAQPLIKVLDLTTADQIVFPVMIGFCGATLLAGGVRFLLLWTNTRLSFAIGKDLSNDIYRRTLYQAYETHISRNSSFIIDAIANKAFSVIPNVILPSLTLLSSFIVLIAILIALVLVDAFIALSAFGGLGLIYLFVMWVTKRMSWVNSQLVSVNSARVIKALQEGLGGIRNILLDGSQKTFSRVYQRAVEVMYRAYGHNAIITSSPRIGVETLGILLIAALAYRMTSEPNGTALVIPTLGALALGAQRLMPVLQQVYGAVAAMRAGQAALMDTLELLEQPMPQYADQSALIPLPYRSQIRLNNVRYRYGPELPNVLDGVDLLITKGSRIGLVGSTGSGKSTLLDIVMGLLQPTSGTLEIDGQVVTSERRRSWQEHIAHVPQTVFLADSTIEENIAFGVPADQVDHARVVEAARQARIAETIETWPGSYQCCVGERGVRLSGGQLQRIGIARALYKQADVIVFDEATSALDNETERQIMQSIRDLSENLTIFIVAHRLTTLKDCTEIVEFGNGKILRICQYEDLIL